VLLSAILNMACGLAVARVRFCHARGRSHSDEPGEGPMKDRKLAARYSRALLAALPDADAAAKADAFLAAVASSMQSMPDLRDVFLNPAVSRREKRAVLTSLAEGQGMPRQVASFLLTVADHGRLEALPVIAAVFHEEREAAAGVVPAVVTTASPLGPELEERTRRALERLTGRKVSLKTEVEPALLGGAVTRIGSMVYDGTLRTQLAKLRRRMSEE
jgi:F-type H+-transporting ATPase subunit delta